MAPFLYFLPLLLIAVLRIIIKYTILPTPTPTPYRVKVTLCCASLEDPPHLAV